MKSPGPFPSPRPPVRRLWLAMLAIVTALAWTPLLAALASSLVATALGCTLNEASAHPCLIAGRDIGEALVVMFVMGWVAILALPIMAGTLVGWFVVWSRRMRGPKRG